MPSQYRRVRCPFSVRSVFRAATLALMLTTVVQDLGAEDGIRFSRDIQPIFAEHCLQCHGPDEEQREAELRLDVEESAKEIAIVPGAPHESELLARISSCDADLRMPPSATKSLNEQQIELLREWIAAGAPYEQHWAFLPIQSPRVPEVGDDQLTDIDKYVVAKLDAKQLKLNRPATRQQLIRRATFDLTGLPPTWSEVTAFVEDTSPRAFEKVVDRLLESTAYGERWGRHWLDLARYADTHGGSAIGFTKFPFSYTYRDYVINAFNQDLPYDQFVTEQLAADQLGLANNAEQLAALGFLTIGMQFRNPHNRIDDQIDVVTRGMLGLTVACARCHDHKFDAITTRDYYSLYATFASSKPPEELPRIGAQEPSDALSKYDQNLQHLTTSYRDMARDQSEIMRGRLRMQVGLYLREIAKGAPEPDLVSADVLSYRTDDLRPHVLHRWQKYLKTMPAEDAVFGPWVKLSAFHASQTDSANFADSCKQLVATLKQENGESTKDLHRLSVAAPRWNPRVLETLDTREPKSMAEVANAYGELFGEVHKEWLRTLVELSLEAEPGTPPVPDESEKHLAANSSVNRQLRRHLYGPNTPTNLDDHLASRVLNRPINDNVSGRRSAIHNLNLTSSGSPARAMSLSEQTMPAPFFVFVRGDPLQRGDPVSARFLSALGGTEQVKFTPGARRLDLARSIVNPDNPLTRRVIVNWVWQHHFGTGLVRTPDDFGTRGTAPTHPQLLDYLATKLLEDNWSLKKLHRRMMLSQTYQQASIERPGARRIDPNNELLWRRPRQRLELEAMRDAMLRASGELNAQLGGRPFDLLSTPIVPRRSVYALVNRDIVSPLMSTFDAANPSACTARRPETTVPQQTLFALNSDFIQDRAANLAKLVADTRAQDKKPDAERVRQLYRRTFSRDPDDSELKMGLEYVAAQGTNEDIAKRWQQLAHVLLAANEFVFVD